MIWEVQDPAGMFTVRYRSTLDAFSMEHTPVCSCCVMWLFEIAFASSVLSRQMLWSLCDIAF